MSKTKSNKSSGSKESTTTILFRLPKELKERFKETSDAKGTTMTEVIIERVKEFVNA